MNSSGSLRAAARDWAEASAMAAEAARTASTNVMLRDRFLKTDEIELLNDGKRVARKQTTPHYAAR